MKQFVVYLLLIVPMAFFTACSKDEDNQNERPTNEVNDGSGNDGYVGDHVIINDDGTTSNGSRFTAIDNTNFYLDYVKYSVVEGHLEVSGYDKAGFKGEAKIVSKITYKGNTYEVLAISRSAFSGCGVLTSIKMPNCVTSIGDSAFHSCSHLTSINIPNSVTKIGSSAFYSCRGLTSIIIPNSVKSIWSGAFCYCTGLKSITIPNSVTYLEESIFCGCTGLTSITIPNSVKSIGNSAFYGCSGLTSVTIGNSVTSIGGGAFDGCSNLKKVIVSDIAAWCGISFSFDSNPLYYAHHLYSGENTEITYLIIPNSVKSIGNSAFYGCSGLTSVTIGNSVTWIERYAFSGCSGLTSVTIGNSVKSIGYSAFSGCSGLTSITIPNSVTSIESYAFSGCSGLTTITSLNTTPPTINSNTFSSYNATLMVPTGSKSAYETADYWRRFKNIVEI